MEKILELDKLNEVYFRVRNLTKSSALELKEFLSCFVENYWFHPKYRAKTWDGRISFYDWKTQTIPIGLFPQFVKFCKTFGYQYNLNFGRDEIINEILDEEFEQFYEAIFHGEEIRPRDYQDECIKKAIRMKRGVIESPTGCHSKGTEILMYDGSLKKVEDIVTSDILMGPNNEPKNVLRTIFGKEKMYKITPKKGESFIVNENHILHLKMTNGYYINKFGEYVNISIKDYLQKNQTFKHESKLVSNSKSIIFKNNYINSTKLSPYFIGLYLGDGSVHSCAITTMDKFRKLGLNFGMSSKFKRTNCESKFIPDCIKKGSIKDRLEVLAGLIDSDGCLTNGTYYEMTLKSKRLIEDISFIARSVGLFVSKIRERVINGVTYFRCNILGDIQKIPVRIERKKKFKKRNLNKSVFVQGFDIEELPEDNFYGFQLDGDNLYMTNDFIIHHNSGKSLVIYSILRFLLGTCEGKLLLIVPNVSLVNQFYSDCKEYGWKHAESYCSLIFSKSKQVNEDCPIVISTWQSLIKRSQSFLEQFQGVLVDECLHPSTMITMSDGSKKRIDEIKVGEKILSYNLDKKILENDEVIKVYENLQKSSQEEMYELEFDNGVKIQVTGNHKFLTKNRGYIRADEINEKDDVIFEENI